MEEFGRTALAASLHESGSFLNGVLVRSFLWGAVLFCGRITMHSVTRYCWMISSCEVIFLHELIFLNELKSLLYSPGTGERIFRCIQGIVQKRIHMANCNMKASI